MPKINKALILEITPEQFLNQCSPLELKEIYTLIQGTHYVKRMESQTCYVCGCSDYDCKQCIELTGKPCYWFEENLCSACASNMTSIKTIEHEPGT